MRSVIQKKLVELQGDFKTYEDITEELVETITYWYGREWMPVEEIENMTTSQFYDDIKELADVGDDEQGSHLIWRFLGIDVGDD